MQRLTKYEMITIILLAVALVGTLASRLSGASLAEELFKFAGCATFIIAIVLIFVRADRLYSAQRRAREEIYQVLYTLHGNDKLTEHQARKTRDHIEASKVSHLEEIQGLGDAVDSLTRLMLQGRAVPATKESLEVTRPEDGSKSIAPASLVVTNKRILAEYSERLRSWANHAEAVGLMNRSLFVRDILAYAATFETLDARQLYLRFRNGIADETAFRYEWLYRLGRFVFFQGEDAEDADFALYCLKESAYKLRRRSNRRDALRFQIELLAELGEFEEASKIYKESEGLLGDDYHYLWVDLQNPFVQANGISQMEWLEAFNEPFISKNLNGIKLAETSGRPFDRVESAPSAGPLPMGPLVTVIMTSYAPDEKALRLAACSILQQSWRNLELIIVDDATPGGAPEILDDIAEKDSRVRLIRLSENRGTYHARNVGLRAARGDFITGQDSDDWSHPDRIYRQVRALQRNSSAAGVAITAIRSDDNLFRVLRGIAPHRLCEVSLMFPRELARAMGGYIEARKGADSEFRLRLALYSERPVLHLDEPLYLTRLSTGSLSRSDFKRGWAHQNRRAFSSFIRQWHRTASGYELSLATRKSQSAAIPPKFRSSQSPRRRFDVVYLSDWRFDDSTVKASLAELEALQQAGKTVGIIQLAGLFPGQAQLSELSARVQNLINDERLTLVIPDEEAIIESLVVRTAELLQFIPMKGFQGRVRSVTIIADKAPSYWDGSSPIYHPYQCNEVAAKVFGVDPVWTTFDPAVHRLLYAYGQRLKIHPRVLPPVLPTADESALASENNNAGRTIIGRPARNLEGWWPDKHDVANFIWPEDADSGVEVHLLGDASCYLRKYGRAFYPSHWACFSHTDVDQDAFYSSIDYFAFYPDETWPQEFSYEALIAYSNGATVLLPPQFGPMHQHNAYIVEAAQISKVLGAESLQGTGTSSIHSDYEGYEQEVARSMNMFTNALESLTSQLAS